MSNPWLTFSFASASSPASPAGSLSRPPPLPDPPDPFQFPPLPPSRNSPSKPPPLLLFLLPLPPTVATDSNLIKASLPSPSPSITPLHLGTYLNPHSLLPIPPNPETINPITVASTVPNPNPQNPDCSFDPIKGLLGPSPSPLLPQSFQF